jgi:predicted  nucleic acid-binding Zn-ribbon protein
MAEINVRKDAENLAILERLRPEYERLKTEKIRSESDVERYEKELADARAAAVAALGTADLMEIRGRIERDRAVNTEAVDAFEAALAEIRRSSDALGKA